MIPTKDTIKDTLNRLIDRHYNILWDLKFDLTKYNKTGKIKTYANGIVEETLSNGQKCRWIPSHVANKMSPQELEVRFKITDSLRAIDTYQQAIFHARKVYGPIYN